jgi:hypothetical protein
MASVLAMTTGVAGCKDLTNAPGLPAGTPDPGLYNSRDGAIGLRNAAVHVFELAIPQYLVDAGLLTDELEDRNTGASLGTLLTQQNASDPLDERILPEGVGAGDLSYRNLQNIRAFAAQAIGALAKYDTASANLVEARRLRAELYAFQGYAEILLADLYCSGVPLSTLDFERDFTYHASSTTAQVYQDAIAKFDTALALADTSTLANLARVGKGRAWLALGRYDSAATVVNAVPVDFRYDVSVLWGTSPGYQQTSVLTNVATVSDGEGGTGLPYRSSGDPRTAVDTIATEDTLGNGTITPRVLPLFFPSKYHTAVSTSYATFPIADGIEAALIRAEAQLQPASAPSGPWLATLNQLRAIAGLSDTTDPGTPHGRVALLFHERAYWLFLTGHRQGDLRRLLRQYGTTLGFTQSTVYPTGTYRAPGAGVYGTDVTVPVPSSESMNPLFHGCLSRGA